MSLEFERSIAEEYCIKVADGTHDSPKEVDYGKKLVTSKNIIGGKLDLDKSYFISLDDFDEINKRSKVDQWDILISMIGTVGEVALITEKPDFAIKNVGLLKNNNEYKAKWLYYYLKSDLGQYQIKSRLRGTTQLYIPLKDLRKLEISVPKNHDDMIKIIKILDNIDKKIENNHNINNNLEQLIKYLYISWFENFEPFYDNKFHDTKLGKIPVGWEVKPLQEFIKFQEGPGIRNWQYVEEDGINFLNIRCIQGNDLILDTANMISKEEAKGKYAHFMLNEWDILISSSGTLGRYAIVRPEHLPLCLNTSIIRFKPMHSFNHYGYVYSYLTSRGFYHYLLTMGSGSVQLNFGPTHLKQIDLVVPPEKVLKKYNDLIFPIIEQIVKIKTEISKLIKLRDILLPKLMSGEIDVSKINCDLKLIIKKIILKFINLFIGGFKYENKNNIKNSKSNETFFKPRTIFKINK